MSLLGTIGKIASGVLGVARGAAAGVGGGLPGMIAGGVIGAATSGIGGGGKKPPRLPTISGGKLPALPPGGKIVGLSTAGAAAAGAVAGEWLYDKLGNPVAKRRRRRKGISAKDLSSFKRVARLVDKFSRPVHKMRNFKPSKGI